MLIHNKELKKENNMIAAMSSYLTSISFIFVLANSPKTIKSKVGIASKNEKRSACTLE